MEPLMFNAHLADDDFSIFGVNNCSLLLLYCVVGNREPSVTILDQINNLCDK